MALDDTSLYTNAFGEPATLAGTPVTAVVSRAALVELDGVVTQRPVAVLSVADAPAAAAGQAFSAAGISYSVRQVLLLPPDGALQQLVLARV